MKTSQYFSILYLTYFSILASAAEPNVEERITKAGIQLVTAIVLKYEFERDANCKDSKSIYLDFDEWLNSIPAESATLKEKTQGLQSLKASAERMKSEKPKNSDKTFSQLNYINMVDAIKRQNSSVGTDLKYCEQIYAGINNIFKKAVENAKLIKTESNAAIAERKISDEELRKENVRRMASLAPAFVPRVSMFPNDYAEKLVARIKPNIVYVGDIDDNSVAIVVIKVADDGKIIGVKLEKSSGNKGYDEAVLKAVIRTASVPLIENGKVPSNIEISFRAR